MLVKKTYSTHIPTLIKTVQMTKGPVLEIGSGIFSTPLLHWLCAESRRKLITYDGDREYFEMVRQFKSSNHSIRFVEDWDKVDFNAFPDRYFSVALIDSESDRRAKEAIRLKNKVDYLILHDTNDTKSYGYERVWPEFKYIYHWEFCKPWTSVVSNFKNLEDL